MEEWWSFGDISFLFEFRSKSTKLIDRNGVKRARAIDVVPAVAKAVGAFFMSTYAATIHYYWPPTIEYGDYGAPSNWGATTSTGYNWIPEFPSLIILPLSVITTLIAATVVERRRLKI